MFSVNVAHALAFNNSTDGKVWWLGLSATGVYGSFHFITDRTRYTSDLGLNQGLSAVLGKRYRYFESVVLAWVPQIFSWISTMLSIVLVCSHAHMQCFGLPDSVFARAGPIVTSNAPSVMPNWYTPYYPRNVIGLSDTSIPLESCPEVIISLTPSWISELEDKSSQSFAIIFALPVRKAFSLKPGFLSRVSDCSDLCLS